MTQESLFSPREELSRVGSRIAGAIVVFCRPGRTFHAQDLRAYVDSIAGPTAPGSCDRVLRDLRKRGVVNYSVVNRRASLYVVEDVA